MGLPAKSGVSGAVAPSPAWAGCARRRASMTRSGGRNGTTVEHGENAAGAGVFSA